jgi:hypothetical protein
MKFHDPLSTRRMQRFRELSGNNAPAACNGNRRPATP